MIIRLATLTLVGCLASASAAPLASYLPGNDYREDVPVPSAVLGHEIGEWHVRHDQLVTYLKALAAASDRVRCEEIGRTYEARPLLLLTISSPANLARLEAIREDHLALSDPVREPSIPLDRQPLVINMGYGVHGNEPSASNAALLVAYHLAASRSKEVRDLLEHSVVLLDPCLNPDGFARFAQWANSHRSKHPVASANSREHNEVWPGGRTNHYWFDLNRDWLLARHPESRARLVHYHRWRPNLQTDFHEMGSDSTYFFQPGVPTRRHPLTPTRNVRLTKRIAEFHARTLDRDGTLYFTEERFDDFYYGKGSTYPDVHGAVGILFEQASSRGHLRESIHGDFDFAFTIRNQVRTSLSTFAAARTMRVELLQYQREFYRSALSLAENDPVQGYLFGSPRDPASTHDLLDLLLRHGIEVHALRSDLSDFPRATSYLVPARQPQYRLVKAIFERRTSFEDSVFYDVSAWTLPLAMGISFRELRDLPDRLAGPVVSKAAPPTMRPPARSAVGYAFEWHGQFAPRALHRLHEAGIRAKVTTSPLRIVTSEGERPLDRGSILVSLGIHDQAQASDIHRTLGTIAREDGIRVHALRSGLTPGGADLGSPSIEPLEAPRPLLLVGGEVNAYEAGEVWHLLDQRHDMNLTLVDLDRFPKVDLHEFTHLLMVDGEYDLPEKQIEKLRSWIKGGGILVATKKAARWAAEQGLSPASFEGMEKPVSEEEAAHDDGEQSSQTANRDESPAPKRRPYDQFHPDEDSRLTKGTIFATDLDLTHPLGYGCPSAEHAVFRNSNLILHPSENPYATVAQYAEDPLLAGYVHPENTARIRNSAAVTAERVGNGLVVSFADNPNFRAFWTGTSRLYLNALCFGSVIEKTEADEPDSGGHGHRH